jgi:hypothetical protein
VSEHQPGCRAVNFDETGRYTGTRAFDPERCATCREEAADAADDAP